jgi:Protein of unknown function (DUF4446)
MILDDTTLLVLVIGALIVGIVGLVVAVVAVVKLGRLHRSLALLQVAEGRENFLDVVARTREDIGVLRSEVGELAGELARARIDLSQALRHVSVVRYDAFGDLGGRFSFSAALLDDSGDGIILTSIHGRSETRTYVKGVTNGQADIDLSPEERKAMELAGA